MQLEGGGAGGGWVGVGGVGGRGGGGVKEDVFRLTLNNHNYFMRKNSLYV